MRAYEKTLAGSQGSAHESEFALRQSQADISQPEDRNSGVLLVRFSFWPADSGRVEKDGPIGGVPVGVLDLSLVEESDETTQSDFGSQKCVDGSGNTGKAVLDPVEHSERNESSSGLQRPVHELGVEGKGQENGEYGHLVGIDVEECTEGVSPSLPNDLDVPQSLNVSLKVLFKCVELDDLDTEEELLDSGRTCIPVSRPGSVASVDVSSDVAREGHAEGNASQSDQSAHSQHRVEEECTNGHCMSVSHVYPEARSCLHEMILLVTFGAIVAKEATVPLSMVKRFMT